MTSSLSRTASVLALALILAGASGCQSMAAEAPAAETAAEPPAVVQDRYVHAPELPPIIMPYLNDKGFMNPDFPPTVAEASPYLTDFYGIQAIGDVPADKIIADFEALGAKLERRDEHSLTMSFPGGYSGTFYPMSTLAVVGQQVPVSHVEISDADWRTEQANVRAFRQMVEKAGLAGTYLVPNALYPLEQTVEKQMKSGDPAGLVIDSDLTGFTAARNAILFYPESVHGKPDDGNVVTAIFDEHNVDWLAMEMLGPQQQPLLDAFVEAEEGSAAYKTARAGLLAYFTDAWNGRAGPKVPPEELYYFKMVEAARDAGVRVVGIEQTTVPYILFRYGESTFGGAVRSLEWQMNLPAKGRGIVFGGSGHYNQAQPINVQDFVAMKEPARPIFATKPLVKKAD